MDAVQIVELAASVIIAVGVIVGFYVGKQTTDKQTEDRIKETKQRTIKEKWMAAYLLHSFLEQLAAMAKRQNTDGKKFIHEFEKPEDYRWLEAQFRTYGHLLGDDLCREYAVLVESDKYYGGRTLAKGGILGVPLQKMQNLAAARLDELEESYKELTGVDIKGLSE